MLNLKQVIRKVFVIYNYFCFVLVFVLLFPIIYFLSRKPSRYLYLDYTRKFWAFWGCALSGIFIKKEYEWGITKEELKSSPKPFIFCSNHASYLDTLVMSQVAEGSFFYMGKRSLAKNPVLKIFFKTIDIPFDRDSKTDSYRAFKLAGENLDLGMSLVMFPEGTITSNPPNLRTFKSGAFKLSVEKGIPIVPVTIYNSWEIFYGEGQMGARPGVIRCFVHKPVTINPFSLNPEVELKERVFSIIQNKIQEYMNSSAYPENLATPQTGLLSNKDYEY